MGANNHTTVIPSNAEQSANNPIEYDNNSGHDRYMAMLRLDLIRSGVITP